MPGLNQVQLIGRLGKDPELRTLQNQSQVCSFSLATSEDWKDKQTGEKKQRTEWHNIVVWGKLAEVCAKYLKKGSQAYLKGSLRTRMWEKDGIKHYITEVYVDDMLMLGDKQDSSSRPAPPPPPPATLESDIKPSPGSDDLPF